MPPLPSTTRPSFCRWSSTSPRRARPPDPEVSVRTSGEQRLSGFLLWQASDATLQFDDPARLYRAALAGTLTVHTSQRRTFGRCAAGRLQPSWGGAEPVRATEGPQGRTWGPSGFLSPGGRQHRHINRTGSPRGSVPQCLEPRITQRQQIRTLRVTGVQRLNLSKPTLQRARVLRLPGNGRPHSVRELHRRSDQPQRLDGVRVSVDQDELKRESATGGSRRGRRHLPPRLPLVPHAASDHAMPGPLATGFREFFGLVKR